MTAAHSEIDVTRPIVRYHGGKWRIAPWIIRHFPSHRVYTEVFGGGGSVLMRKPRSYAEIYNDLDGEMVNLFRVIRSHAAELSLLIRGTPYARDEYALSFDPCDDPIEQARRTVIRCYMGFGSNSHNRKTKSGFRANSRRSHTTPAHDWANLPPNIIAVGDRLRGVVIENRNAIDLLPPHDAPDTLHYLDPPYVHSTRSQCVERGRENYTHEMSDDQHAELAEVVGKLAGAVMISGYRSPLYDRLYPPPKWHLVECDAMADGARPRVEVLWMNERCYQLLHGAGETLFGGVSSGGGGAGGSY